MSIQDIVIKPTISDPIIELTGSNGFISKIQQTTTGLTLSSGSDKELTLIGGPINLYGQLVCNDIEIRSGSDLVVRGDTFLGDQVTDVTTISGDLAVNGGDITTTSATLNVGNTSTNTQTLNLGSAITSTGTKTINLGTGGIGGTTDVNIGASNAGTVTVNSPNVVISGDLAVNGGDITTTASTLRIGSVSINTQTMNIGTAATAAATKTINLGTGAASGTTNINIGDDNAGTTTINSPSVTLIGDLAVNGGDITTTSSTLNIGNISNVTQTINLGSAGTTSISTKTINIGTGGFSDSVTNVNIGSNTSGATGAFSVRSSTSTFAGVVKTDKITEASSDSGVDVEGIILRDSSLITGSLVRKVQHIPVNFANPTATLNDSRTFSTNSLGQNFITRSMILMSTLDVGDKIEFFSHIKKGTPTASVGASAIYTSTIHVGVSDSETGNIVSKISFDNDNWYEASHIVTAQILSISVSQITMATTGMACNVHNSEASSVPATIIPRIITFSWSGTPALYFVQRGVISSANTTSWTMPVDREVDKCILHKFKSSL